MSVPSAYHLLLLGLAAFRTWKIIGEDTILDRPRAALIARLDRSGRGRTGHRRAQYVSTLLECPWCAGFWIALSWWGAFQLWPHGTIIATVPLVLSAIVGLIGYFT